MAALQCEICGGKLMAKSGGLFECEYCGMQYDKTRIQEMVQEIKGTVKVEGTVEVTYGKKTHIIEAGDSIYYDSIVPHHVHGFQGQAAKILAVVYTPI